MKKLLLVASMVLLVGAGCSEQPEKPIQQAPPPPAEQPAVVGSAVGEPAKVTNIYDHPKFGFTFILQLGVVGIIDANGNDVHFVGALDGKEYGSMIIQPGIPGIALQDSKVEKIKVGGVAGHLYHDTDAADGGDVDKLIVDFPKGNNTLYFAAPDLPGIKQLDLKAIAASWNWQNN